MGNTFGRLFRVTTFGESHGGGIGVVISGIFEGKTLGTPLTIMVRNKDARPEDYSEIAGKFRPSHADYTYEAKYGIRNWQGGGRASARETIGRVAAGAVAKKILS